MSTKLEAYLSVASIQHYLIVDTERSVVIHHRRTDEQTWQTRILHAGQSMRLDPPGITIDIAAIFG